MADRIVVMNQGAIEQVGTPQRDLPRAGDGVRRRFRRRHELPRRHRSRRPTASRSAACRLDCPAQDGLAPGSRVRLCIRPEDVRVRDLPADVRQPARRRGRRARFRRRVLPRHACAPRRAMALAGRLLQQPDPRSRRRAGPPARRSRCRPIAAGLRRVSLSVAAPRCARSSRDDLRDARRRRWRVAAMLLLIVGLPLWSLLAKGFEDRDGHFVGLANYVAYFSTPALFNSALNSLHVAAVCTAIVVPLAFLYAYALTRAVLPLRWLFQGVALIPIFAPSLLPGLALIYLFGTQGFFKAWLGGGQIYGFDGIVIAQVFYCFPHALMILVTALAHGRRAALRGGRRAGRLQGPRVLHRHPAGRQVRPDQRGAGGVHPGDHRLRHRQGDRRQLQRAGDRRLQAGDRPAELLDGRGGRHGAAGAGGARLRHRPLSCSAGRWRC